MKGIGDRLRARIAEREGGNGSVAVAQPPPRVVMPPVAPAPPPPKPAPLPEGLAARASVRAAEAAQRADAGAFAEVKRILSLPATAGLAPEEKAAFDASSILAHALAAGFRWFDCQAEAILSYLLHRGCIAPIPVGRGKTLVSLAVVEAGSRLFGVERSLLLVPASVYPQLVQVDLAAARERIPLSVSFHLLGQRERSVRRALAASGRPGCYIVPYSILSREDAVPAPGWLGLLQSIDAGLVVADEAHSLRHRHSAKTHRFLAWAETRRPHLVALSGTLTSRSIRDYHHLIHLALGQGSPLPLSPRMCDEWAHVLDSDSPFSESQATETLKPLVDWSRRTFPSIEIPFGQAGYRKAYQLRLNSAPGVVQPVLDEIGTSLTICNKPVLEPEASPGWEDLERLTRQVIEDWKTPNGDEIEDAIQTYKWLRELTAGFYNELIWPSAERLCRDRGIPDSEAERLLDAARMHHRAKQSYVRDGLRDFLKAKKPGLDTPMLVGLSMAIHGGRFVPVDVFNLWREMKSLEVEGMPERERRAVRVCPYKIDAAARWVLSFWERDSNQGLLVWYIHRDVGLWLRDELSRAGFDPLHCPAGNAANRELTDPERMRLNSKRVVVLSLLAHHQGKNLQGDADRGILGFGENYFMEWPRPANLAEQSLGRTHRVGQVRDELRPVTCHTTDFDVLAMAATLNDALYVQQTTGSRQKLLYAGYDPVPEIVPPAVLQERGFEPRRLDGAGQEALQERFGGYKK